MNAGDFRHVITLQRRVEVQAASGAVTWAWEDWQVGVRAAIESTTGSKRWTAAQVQAEVSTVIRIRFRPGVTPKMRAVHVREVSGSPQVVDYYEVEAVVDVGSRRRELQLFANLRPADGFRTYGS